jgi:sugar phosphate isomerase/epimerase
MRPFINVPYRMVENNIPRIANLGVGIEIYIDNHLAEDLSEGEAKALGERLREEGIACTLHAPFMDLSPGGYDRKVRAITRERLVRAAVMASHLGALVMVCHPGFDRWRFDGHEQLWFDGSVETWQEVLKSLDRSIPLAMENVFEERPDSLAELFRFFRKDRFMLCFDTGHFNLFSKVPLAAWIVPFRDRIAEMHLHDNHNGADEHLPIGRGTFPFRELKSLLGGINGRPVFVAEVHGEPHAGESIERLKEFLGYHGT